MTGLFGTPPSFAMPAGQYYIGDLCYVLSDRWTQVCNLTIDGPYVKEGKFTLPDGTEFVLFSALSGDGVCVGDTPIDVDSWSIGCVKVSDIDNSIPEDDIDLGVHVTFEDTFVCTGEEGVLKFGHVVVDTRHIEFRTKQ